MIEKKVLANILIILLILVSILPSINGYNLTIDSKNRNGEEIIYKEYYPGATYNENICYYIPEQAIICFENNIDINDLTEVDDHPIIRKDTHLNSVLLNTEDTDLTTYIEQLNNRNDICFAERNIVGFSCDIIPNDPNWTEQWGHQMIKCPWAWETTKGDNVKVAVLDSGIDTDHEDFGNGKIPYGKNMLNGSEEHYEDDTNNSHGTHCAGIIGACFNNEIGIAGVAPDCQIIPVKVINKYNAVNASNLAFGIMWATFEGNADIISMSLTMNRADIVEQACNDAYNYGVVLVAATGNNYHERILYPANYSSVIAVGAIDQNKEKCDFSNYGENLDFVAPGKDIISTIRNNEYEYSSGTSEATAYVAGILALYIQEYPSMSPSDLKERLIELSFDLGKEGKDKYYGHGLVRAYKNKLPSVKIISPKDGETVYFWVWCWDVICPGITGESSDPEGDLKHVEVKISDYPWAEIKVSHTGQFNCEWFDCAPEINGHVTIYARSFDGEEYSPVYKVNVISKRSRSRQVLINNPMIHNLIMELIEIFEDNPFLKLLNL